MNFFYLILLFTFPLFAVTFEYIDGNGNQYILKDDILEYIPIQPEYSSSGFYSGGEPFSEKLNPKQKQALEKLFLESKSLPESQKELYHKKGSGLVVIGQTSVLVKQNSSYQKKLELELNKFKKK